MKAWLKRCRFTREIHDHFASYDNWPFKNWTSWDEEDMDSWASNL